MFTGSLVAIVTPFKKGKLDERTFGDLIEWQISNGTNGIVPCGTTGESATLTHEEHHRVVKLAVEVARRRVPIVAGTGSNSTEEAISLTRHAKEAGVDGALLITPYYNKPTQEGLYRHYKAIAEAVDLALEGGGDRPPTTDDRAPTTDHRRRTSTYSALTDDEEE